MSYKKISVNSNEPNTSNEVSLNLSDLITVNSPTTGQLLKKTATDWGTDTLSAFPEGTANYLSGSGSGNTVYTYDVNDNYIYRTASNELSIYNNNFVITTSSGSYVPISTGSWTMAIRLQSTYKNGKKILCRAVVTPFRTSNSSFTVQWHIGKDAIGDAIPIGPKCTSTYEFGSTAYGLYEPTGETSDYLTLRVMAMTGSHSITAGLMAFGQQINFKILNQ
jgi:hypothetical protein